MRLYEYVPIDDPVIGDESLIDQVFGPGFCVADEIGQLLTTAHNRNLLRRAKALVENATSLDEAELAEALGDLAARAETMSQSEYELAVAREMRDQHYAENYIGLAAD